MDIKEEVEEVSSLISLHPAEEGIRPQCLLDLLDVSWDPTVYTTPEHFYNNYRSIIQATLGRRGDVIKWKNTTLAEDEELTPSQEDLILLNVLTLIHPTLPRYVKNNYGQKIGSSQRLMDFKTDILTEAKQYITDNEKPQPVQVEFYTEAVVKEETDVIVEAVNPSGHEMLQSSLQLPDGGIEAYLKTELKVKGEYLEPQTEGLPAADFSNVQHGTLGVQMLVDINGGHIVAGPITQGEKRKHSDGSVALASQNQIKIYSCDICEYSAGDLINVKCHKESQHAGMVYPCGYCEYVATTNGSLQRHQWFDHVDSRYPCDQCLYSTSTASSLKAHKNRKHEGIRYQCDQCEYAAATISNLKFHKDAKHDGVRYNCDQCEYKAIKPNLLRRHKESKHEGIRFPCDLCEITTGDISSLMRHKERKH